MSPGSSFPLSLLQHLTCVWIQKGQVETPFFHPHPSIFFFAHFSSFLLFNQSWLELSAGQSAHTAALCPHGLQFSSQSAELGLNWSGHVAAGWGCKEEKSHLTRRRQRRGRNWGWGRGAAAGGWGGEERKTSRCNLLPQHSVSDVVWHLVHKANPIHTLP